MKRFAPASILLFLALAACQPPQSSPRLGGAGMDMFTPVKMRVHPLSRIVFPTTASTTPATSPATSANPPGPGLEARVELTDQFGDPAKGAGSLMLQLFDESTPAFGRRPIQTWSLSISSPAENRDHWDRTTRTYLFRLPLSAEFPRPGTGHDRFLLNAVFTLTNGHSLSDQLELQNR